MRDEDRQAPAPADGAAAAASREGSAPREAAWAADDPPGDPAARNPRRGGARLAGEAPEAAGAREAGEGAELADQGVDAVDAEEGVRGASATDAPGRHGSFLRELPVLILVALLLALLIKAFLVQAFHIPSGSMENTLQVGDRVLVNKLVYRFRDIRRGEIVVFNGLDSFTPEVTVSEPANPVQRVLRAIGSALGATPSGERDFIKRVVGVPGDRVRCCDPQGRVVVNDRPLDEDYVFPGDRPSEEAFGPITVPPGRLWVMGDHRSMSADSRSHLGDPGGGTVPADKVIGRAFVIVWPPDRLGLLRVPDTFQRSAAAAVGYAADLVAVPPLAATRHRPLQSALPGRSPDSAAAAFVGSVPSRTGSVPSRGETRDAAAPCRRRPA